MINQGIKEIIQLNKEFYSKHNESFDKSRSFGFWKGFEEILLYLPENLKILDLGCGNARFLKFLHEKNSSIGSYIGIDNSIEFIEKNKQIYPQYNFKVLDVISEIEELNEKYSLITAFGITHHIPNKNFRENWFLKLETMLNKGGFLVLSFWNFDKTKDDSEYKTISYQKEKGDYFLGWKEDYTSHRYCHYFEKEEITEVISLLKGCTLIKSFQEDQNTYLILQKNS